MNARDELYFVIFAKLSNPLGDHASAAAAFAADAILAAGYTKPRTVTTVDELIALPVDTIVREIGDAQYAWEKYGIDTKGNGEDEWYRMGWDGTFDPDVISLPALVIFEGVQS